MAGAFARPFFFISQGRWKALFVSPQDRLYFHHALWLGLFNKIPVFLRGFFFSGILFGGGVFVGENKVYFNRITSNFSLSLSLG